MFQELQRTIEIHPIQSNVPKPTRSEVIVPTRSKDIGQVLENPHISPKSEMNEEQVGGKDPKDSKAGVIAGVVVALVVIVVVLIILFIIFKKRFVGGRRDDDPMTDSEMDTTADYFYSTTEFNEVDDSQH